MSFFNRQPDMFDSHKRFGSGNNNTTDNELESAPESWVELAPSRASLCSSVEAMLDDGAESNSNHKDSSRLSPVGSMQRPHGVESSLNQVKYRLVKDIKNTDWIWDWSSRPEKQDPSTPSKMARDRSGQIGSTLTTPPNSPEPELSSEFDFRYSDKLQRKSANSSVFMRFEVIVGLVVSNVLTFVLGATIGFCICKKMNKSDSSVKVNYYW